MLIRGLIVLLLVLNLGVALWWALHAPPSTAPSTGPVAGVASLQLVSEVQGDADIAQVAPAASAVVEQCVGFGPFADAAGAEAARARLDPQVIHAVVHRRHTGSPRNWRVFLPPLANAAEVDVVARRILAAGFKDYYVIRDGKDANALALGLFRSEDSARARAQALVAAGFAAQVEPVGAGPAGHWLEVAADAGFDRAGAQALVAAARTEPVDCRRFDGQQRARR
ncbi:MAG TPA: SPOR domain-containing protein [Lysobacter sp.]|nr:SPOR domain-containing protein [Lysobacter sp.]